MINFIISVLFFIVIYYIIRAVIGTLKLILTDSKARPEQHKRSDNRGNSKTIELGKDEYHVD